LYDKKANTPKTELDRRIDGLKTRLIKNKMDAALILQNIDLFYFAGTIQKANLYVPAEGDPILMVYKSIERARAESAIKNIVHLPSPKKIPGILKNNGAEPPRRLGLEMDVLPTNMYFNYRRLFQNTDIIDISPAIRLIRAVKSSYEINIMRRAAELSDRIAGHVPNILQEGMTEL